MDETSAHLKRATLWFQTLSELQKRAFAIAVLGAVTAGLWLATRRPAADAVLSLHEKILPAAALAHLHERGLAVAHLDAAGHVAVPADRAAEAGRWIDELSDSTSSWADEWERSNSQLGQFSGSRERDAAREITRARVIGRLLRQMPGIAQADVIWDEEESAGWRQPQRTRCTVYLRPKSGLEITPDVARSVRQAVAGSKKNLAPSDIVVMDLARMTTFDAVPAGVDDGERLNAERQITEIRREIEQMLSGCDEARVSVAVIWDASPDLAPISLSAQRATGPYVRPVADCPGDELESHYVPQLQITVTAPRDAAESWARQREERRVAEAPSNQHGLVPVSWSTSEPPAPKTSAVGSIRRQIASILGRFERERVPAAVAVHLFPGERKRVAAVQELAPPRSLDPGLFIALAASASLAGAWLLSRVFQTSAPTLSISDPRISLNNDDTDPAPRSGGSKFATSEIEPLDFEGLIVLPAVAWPPLWQATPRADWVIALKGASLQLRRAVLSHLDEMSARELQMFLDQSAPPRLSDIDDSQRRILSAARALTLSSHRTAG